MHKLMSPEEFAAWKQQSEAEIQQIRKETAEIRRAREAAERRLSEQIAETNRQIDKVSRQLGGWTNNANERLEAEFIEALAEAKQIGGIALDGVRGPVKNMFEYDMFGNNCDSVVVGEIKRKLLPEDVRRFAEKRLPYFAKDFPGETAGRKIFGMVAGETIVPDAEREAEKYGLFILRLKNKKLIVGNAEGARAVN